MAAVGREGGELDVGAGGKKLGWEEGEEECVHRSESLVQSSSELQSIPTQTDGEGQHFDSYASPVHQ